MKILKALKARNKPTLEETIVFAMRFVQHHFALSALKISIGSTWADGPGYYISRRWR